MILKAQMQTGGHDSN